MNCNAVNYKTVTTQPLFAREQSYKVTAHVNKSDSPIKTPTTNQCMIDDNSFDSDGSNMTITTTTTGD